MQRTTNDRPLSPISFLERTAYVYPTRRAVVYGATEFTYAQLAERVYRLASALKERGIGKGDCVAFLCPNIPAMLEAHFAVPLTGAILCAINIRLAPQEVEYILNHCEAKALVVDAEFTHLIEPIRGNLKFVETIVNVVDGDQPKPIQGAPDYEAFLERGSPDFIENPLEDENDPISVNYTSGTTGQPKGVLYSHRGAYLNSLGNLLEAELDKHCRYLWTVPMFHCNGWCFTWGITALGATHVLVRRSTPDGVFDLIHREKISMFCGAPTVLISLYSCDAAKKANIDWRLRVYTGGSPPSPTVIREMEKLNIEVLHIYGLTETYGPHAICEWQEPFDAGDEAHRFRMKARQGVANITAHEQRIFDDDMREVQWNGEQVGEVCMRGNNVMLGYYRDPEATAAAFRGGWFHSGDLAVMHPDGYIELRDRSKDIIISGGENISSIEVENVLYRHPDVLEAAVIAIPDDRWGETPKAFVTPKPGSDPSAQDIIDFCRGEMAHFKCPRQVEFGALPKTSTGKIQKYVLREKEWAGREKRIH